jgi:hypothetical protein
MPAQTAAARVAYYGENDVFPELEAFLDDGTTVLDAEGVEIPNYIDLSGATSVVIRISHSRWSHYYSPGEILVAAGPCTIDPDQVNNKGRVTWKPGAGELSPAGDYDYQFRIEWTAGEYQTIPVDTYLPMIVRAIVGGAP